MPTLRAFLLADEQGGYTATEIWRLATASGMTPWAVVHDPKLGYNATVMRARDKYVKLRLDLLESSMTKDPTGMGVVAALLRSLLLEG